MPCQNVTPQSVMKRWKKMAQKIEDERDRKKVIDLAQQLVEEIDRRFGKSGRSQ